ARFIEVVGDVLTHVANSGRRPRIFGELVALLVAEGNHAAALQLEEFWNELQRTQSFSLLCGYQMDGFVGSSLADALDDICAAHSHVVPAESYPALADSDERLRAITALQQKASSLEAEVAQRKASEALLAVQSQVLAMIAVGKPLVEVLTTLARMIEEQADDGIVCSVLVRDPEHQQFNLGIAPSLPAAYIDTLARAPISEPYLGPCGRVAHLGEEVVSADIATDERWPEAWRQLALSHNLHTCYATPIVDAGGSVLGSFGMYYRRPHEPKPADSRLVETATYLAAIAIEQRQTEVAWHRSEEMTQRVLDSSADSIKLLDLDGNVLYMSPGSQRLLEIDDLDLYLHHSWLDLWNSDDRERAREAIAAAREGRVVTFEGFRPTMRGTPKWWDVLISPIHDIDGQPAQLLAISRDITDRKRSEQAQAEARRQAEAALAAAEEAARSREEFLSIASHELRNPIATISGTVQLLRRARALGRLTDQRLDTYLESLDRVSSHLVTLTNDLLDVSRFQRGALPLRPALVDVAELLHDIVQRCEWPDHRVILRADDGPLMAVIDVDRVRQVISNLLSNAVKYSPAADQVRVRLERDGDGILIEVADDGIGLPRGAAESIFTPFQRAPNADRAGIPGLGLGLFIARRIAEQHGGRLWASSGGEGHGTTMSLWLPRRLMEADESSPVRALRA
ncbi:MAG TPA: ATP-binding protein, partial [Thermomicrobiaceae bacterium]|nr:ATP-binding protein [Thermomicrobiaceae bacterium]